MPEFAASVSMMFNEVPLLQRFELAASVGFRAVEIQNPYDERVDDIAREVNRLGIEVALINARPALAAVPGGESEFRAGFEEALDYAVTLGCARVHCLAGQAEGATAEGVYIENLRWASERAATERVQVLIEPLNTTDRPGYFLVGSNHARRIIDAVGPGRVAMQFDAYHLQIMEGALTRSLREHLDVIGHVQISGVPDRHEPDERQEINYPYFLELLDDLGYRGWVGCEYRPRAGTLEGLRWAERYGIGPGRSPGDPRPAPPGEQSVDTDSGGP